MHTPAKLKGHTNIPKKYSIISLPIDDGINTQAWHDFLPESICVPMYLIGR